MKNKQILATLSIAVTAALVATTAAAQETGWYAAANVGMGNLASSSLTYRDGNASETFRSDFDAGFTGGASAGYRFDNRLRLEGEITYRRNEFDGGSFPTLGNFNGGDYASLGLGVNALYDFPLGSSERWSGFVGLGYMRIQEVDIDFDIDGQQEVSFETSGDGLQLKLGGRYAPSDRWFVEAGATWFDGGSVSMELPSAPAETLTADYEHLRFTLGAGFRF